MSETISIRNIRAYGRHGVLAHEASLVQPLDVDVELEVDAGDARRSDALSDTVDYSALHSTMLRIIRERSYALLERLGDELVREALRDPRVLAARITIAKPRLLGGATPSVTVRATRTGGRA